MKERKTHADAFEAYYAMGHARSLTRLSEQLGVSRSTLRNWSASFNWQELIEERDRDVATQVASRSVRTEVQERSKQRQLIELGLVTLARQPPREKIRGTLADLDRLLRLERFLEGEADSRQKIVARELKGKTTEELRAMLRRELAELAERAGEDILQTLPPGTAELAMEPPESATETVESATAWPRRDQSPETA